MKTSYYTEEIERIVLDGVRSGAFRLDKGVQKYFSDLLRHFPLAGSDIDWSVVRNGRTDDGRGKDKRLQFATFFDDIVKGLNIQDNIIYISDGPMDVAVVGSISEFRKVIPDIISYPLHHYFVHPYVGDYWCMVLRMTGEMAFGYAPSDAKESDGTYSS